ncbi:MAG: hypothetical protein HXY34_03775 [Candidatus Thorarchaeota archaeon]|nr:hypothetical protein [Candidatus Thorarchaeota archaeon]
MRGYWLFGSRRSFVALCALVCVVLSATGTGSITPMAVLDTPGETVDLGDGTSIEVAPDEVLMKYVIAGEPTSMAGNGDPLTTSEYGTRTDTFTNRRMVYYPSGTITTANLSVPLGDQWEGYSVFGNVKSITENRSWLVNPGFATDATWGFGTSYEEGAFNGNNRVQYFTSSGTYTGQWGSRGTGNGQFIDPWGIAFDSSSNLYVADTQNNRIQVFSSTGTYLRQWGSFGTGNGQFNRPTGVAIDGSGLVYVVDSGNDRIQVFNSAGVYQRQWGSSGVDDGEFRSPTGIAYSSFNGYIYVTDTGNDRVQYFTTAGVRQGGWGGLLMPTGIAVRPSNGYVFVADTSNNRIVRTTATGGSATTITGIYTPMGVAVSPDSSYLYVCAVNTGSPYSHVVRRYNADTNAYQTQWGSDGSGNGQFRFNFGIAVDSAGNVYVSESGGFERMDANWLSTGHGTGNPSSVFQIDGYWHNPGGGLYGYWYNPGDKAFVRQDLVINRGDVTWAGLSLDYYADCRGWGSYMTGFFELFVSSGDPDHGGSYLWSAKFDAIADDNVWYSTGLIPVDYSGLSLPNVQILAGLRVTQAEWYRAADIRPEGRLDNIVLYVKAKAMPTDVSLRMNGVAVTNGATYGLGTATYNPVTPWTSGYAYANFSWSPNPNPPDPNIEISLFIDVDVTVSARRHNVPTISDTEFFTVGDMFSVTNASAVQWTTNHYAAVPGGYNSFYYFRTTIPSNRDVNHVGQPNFRLVNLTYGWNLGNPGDGLLNVSAYQVTTTAQNGFWYLKGTSPNMVTGLQVWNPTTSAWTTTHTFRAGDDTRFRATLPSTYQNDVVYFTVYDPTGAVWTTLQATVDSSGYAVTSYVDLDAVTARTGAWEVQAYVNDTISSGSLHNVGFFRRGFSVRHSTSASVKYPVGGETWTKNVTYGQLVLLQVRVNDSDNGDLLPGGSMTYSWAYGSGVVNDLGTGEYSVTLDTNLVSTPGRYEVSLAWSKAYYDSLDRVFSLNVIFTTDLFSPDAPGVSVPSGYDAQLTLRLLDQLGQPVSGASIVCNWTLDTYTVTPGAPGYYTLAVETDNVPLKEYKVSITASKDYYESRIITLSVHVRELYTSAIPSASSLVLPVGYNIDFTITYTDTDHNVPISGAAGAITCNWSAIHGLGDLNYTVVETATQGLYRITLYSMDDDVLGNYTVRFDVQAFGSQNHTFYVDVRLRTHLTSFYLSNPIDPTAYTADVEVIVIYYDADVGVGIGNGSASGYNVHIYVKSSLLPTVAYTVVNGSMEGEYIIRMAASQWGSLGVKDLTIYANWTGPTVKYYNRVITTSVDITATPTDIFVGQNPLATPYLENITFTVIYYDLGAQTGIVNGTGPYAGNVHITVEVLTAGQTLTQSQMVISEVDYVGSPGEYRIEFNTTFLSGLVSCQLRVYLNWSAGQLPLYRNQTLVITVYSTYRQTQVDRVPLPVTPYDELVNMTLTYYDTLSGQPILPSASLQVYITEPISYVVFANPANGGTIYVQLDTSDWTPGTHTFHLNVVWSGSPYYQNRTGIAVTITVRERNTDLTHGSYSPVQYGNNLTLTFTYRDLDDYSTAGMNGRVLTLDAWLMPAVHIVDNGDGTYTVTLNTGIFPSLGVFTVNASISYGPGPRYCLDAQDFFYLTIVERRTQLTSEVPELAPYLTQANITVTYYDDNTGQGIAGASITAYCSTSNDPLQLGINYFVDYLGSGMYRVRISTVALGTFGGYTIEITASFAGAPFYQERSRPVDIEVSRRPATVTVTRSPLSTPFLEDVVFTISATDGLSGGSIVLTKSVLVLTHGIGTLILDSQYTLTAVSDGYTISFPSDLIVSSLVSDYPIYVKFVWGNSAPYYSNSTTATQVTITTRFTQVTVLSTPPADYGFNITALIQYNDYLSGSGLVGATVSLSCLNDSVFTRWVIDNANGKYSLLVDTLTLLGIGKYVFRANVSWSGSPFYENWTDVEFAVSVTPVSTDLQLVLPAAQSFYAGDTITANITFSSISTGIGIALANVVTNWNDLYGPGSTILEIGGGVYRLTINTTGLDAGTYSFTVSAAKQYHVNRTVSAQILLVRLPVDILLTSYPGIPVWGEDVTLVVNVTSIRSGLPVLAAEVNVTFSGVLYLTNEMGGGLYNCTIDTSEYIAGEFVVTVSFEATNFEDRVKDFQLRIARVSSTLNGSLSTSSAVNGQSVRVTASYRVLSSGADITSGTVTFSWIGGSGLLTWNATQSVYVGTIAVEDVPIGSHSVLLQASSDNYKSVVGFVTIEVREVNVQMVAYGGVSVIAVVSGDIANLTIYLNNTDLNRAVVGADVMYSVAGLSGNLTELGGGYYTVLVNTTEFPVREWVVLISSAKVGYTPSSLQYTLIISRIPTRIVVVGPVQQEAYYGRNVTFVVTFWDEHNNRSIAGATSSFSIEDFTAELTDAGNGTYSIEVNSTVVFAGPAAYDVVLSLVKDRYYGAYVVLKMKVNPIPTQILGQLEVSVPVTDDYTQYLTFWDSLNHRYITDATAVAVWEFGTLIMHSYGNGTYRIGPQDTNRTRLEVRSIPYSIRVTISRGNYSRAEETLLLTIRLVNTELRVAALPTSMFANTEFTVRVVYWDLDHNVPIPGATNSTLDSTLTRVPGLDRDYGNGTYLFGFMAPGVGIYHVTLNLDREDYATAVYVVNVITTLTPEQQMLVNYLGIGALLAVIGSSLASLWIRVLSVPKMLRWLRKMVSRIAKGIIPDAPPVRDRRQLVLDAMNEDLAPLKITKTFEDLSVSTVEVEAMDVESLLTELGVVVGLTDSDLDTLRQDLEKMRPSERAGFVSEVLRQERARRAKDLAEVAAEGKTKEAAARPPTDAELTVFRERLLAMGISATEVDLMVEQAKGLTKAEVDALLDQIGGGSE